MGRPMGRAISKLEQAAAKIRAGYAGDRPTSAATD